MDFEQEQTDQIMALQIGFHALVAMLHMNRTINADHLCADLQNAARDFRQLAPGVQPGSFEDATPLAVELEALADGIERLLDSLGETAHVRLMRSLYSPPSDPD